MKRGDNIIKRPDQSFAQGSNTLFAKPENVKRGGIALGQIFVKGRVAKKMKWDWTIHWADGKMAIWLKDNYHIKYEPNLYSLFDWFEPGRWNK